MNTIKYFKTGILLIIVLAFSLKLTAADVITFTCSCFDHPEYNTYEKLILISATEDEDFTVNWGDGSVIETKTGMSTGNHVVLTYTYSTEGEYTVTIAASNNKCRFTSFDCSDIQLIDLDLTSCPALEHLGCSGILMKNLDLTSCPALKSFECHNSQLTHLDLTGHNALTHLYCYNNQLLVDLNLTGCLALETLYCYENQLKSLNLTGCSALWNLRCYRNRLQLSELYAAHLLVSHAGGKLLGRQELLPRTVVIGDTIDFSMQSRFEGIATSFLVTKGEIEAVENIDYIINNGIITFINAGNYTLTMWNNAIVSHSSFPVSVKMQIKVMDNNSISAPILSNIKMYPVPTDNILFIECENYSTIKLYNMLGRELLIQEAKGKTGINLSHLPEGVYCITVISKGKVIGNSKIVKR